MSPSRRELLASFLGAPFALAACRRAHAITYDGEIVGGAAPTGHALRAVPVDPGAVRRARVDACAGVAIIGGGAAGLSAAWQLARAGMHDVRVFDLEDVAGGTARAGRNAVSAYPWGAHYVPVPMPENRALVALLREMGVIESLADDGSPIVREECLVRDLDERVFAEGVWHEGLFVRDGASPDDLAQLATFQRAVDAWVDFRDARGRRAFALPTSLASTHPDVLALDRITMADWMRAHRLTSTRLRWLIDYACRDDYGLTAEHTSAWAGMLYFASRVRRGGENAEELIAFPEGNGRLVAHLARPLGSRVSTGMLVTDVVPCDDGVRVVTMDARTHVRTVTLCAQAIVATPHFVAQRIVEPWRSDPPFGSERFTYAPWMVANLTLRDRPVAPGLAMAWDNVLRDSPSLGYVDATHQSARDEGSTVLTYYLPLTGDAVRAERQRLLDVPWHGWADTVLADLGRAHPDLDALVTRLDVYRWGHAMVRPVPGLRTSGALGAASRPIDDRIFFAHTDLSALALFEEAQDHGIRAANEVLVARGLVAPPFA